MDQMGLTEAELSKRVPRRRGEGESVKGAIEELRQQGREVVELLTGKCMVRHTMAAVLGSIVDATLEEKDAPETEITSMRAEARAAGVGRKNGHFAEDQNNNKARRIMNWLHIDETVHQPIRTLIPHPGRNNGFQDLVH
ncbi:UNVERIFIED_CONTAM: hypothetical protein FKN15_020269 [Acipenser sinensis]